VLLDDEPPLDDFVSEDDEEVDGLDDDEEAEDVEDDGVEDLLVDGALLDEEPRLSLR
jgi:hypothetical protein